jgi:hypothetical protein
MEFLKKSLNQVNVQENTLYDIIYDLFFFAKLQESEVSGKNGRGYSWTSFPGKRKQQKRRKNP